VEERAKTHAFTFYVFFILAMHHGPDHPALYTTTLGCGCDRLARDCRSERQRVFLVEEVGGRAECRARPGPSR